MEENVGLVCNTTEENLLAMFEKNPPMKQAFDHLWESQHMDEWVEQTAMPALRECPYAFRDMEALKSAIKTMAMMGSIERGMERLIAEHADSSFVDCATKAIMEEAKNIAKTCKSAFFQSIMEATSRVCLEALMDFMFDN